MTPALRSAPVATGDRSLVDDPVGVVHYQQTRLLFTQGRAGALITLAVSVALVGFFWDRIAATTLLPWLGAVLAISGWRMHLVRQFERVDPPDAELDSWRRRFLLGTTASGIMLGSAWWFMAPHASFEGHVILCFVLGGMSLGAAQVLGSAFHVFVTYVSILCLPGTVFLFAQDSRAYLAMSAMSLIFYAAMLATGRGQHRTLMRIMSLTAANRELREHQTRLRDFADMGADLFWECDQRGHFSYLSEGYEALTGIAPPTLIGKPLDAPEGPCFVPATQFTNADGPGIHEQSFFDHAVVWTRSDGSNAVMLSNALPVRDDSGRFLGLRGTVRDITEQHRLAEKLTHQATHDALTELANRREFERRLEALLDSARDASASHCVCYLDLDQFKVVNDTCGHAAGDALLRQIAGQLRLRMRSRDTLARLGGDEFGLLIEHCTLDNALRLARDVHDTIESMRFGWEGRSFRLTASIGLVMVDDQSENQEEIMRRADSACYAAKEAGRNRIHVYEPHDEELSRRHGEMQWVTRITHALDHGELVLASQPIISLAEPAPDGEPSPHRHFELLLRMRGDDGETIPPGSFLPAAERYNLATRLDQWVIDAAFAWLLADPRRLEQVEICSINISGGSLTDPVFLDALIARLRQGTVPGEKLCFEVTETTAVRDLASATRFMQQLQAFGCQFALDDFGTGSSSFAYLRSLPVEFVKIDGMFVRDMMNDDADLAMVKAIHDISRILGKKTVAEFVESAGALQALRALGVDYAQGNAIGEPRPL